MLKNLTAFTQIFFAYWLLCFACFLMLRIIMGYTTFESDVQFLSSKQAYIHDPVWITAFYIHVFSAVIALGAGFTQFSKSFLRNHRKWHRMLGKTYAWNIMLINFPAAMILAINANGGLAGKTAFILLDCLWVVFTFKAVICAQNKDFYRHERYMIRSYALTLSAITLRLWHLILLRYFDMEGTSLYVMEAWLGFVPNLLIAECIICNKNYRLKSAPRKESSM